MGRNSRCAGIGAGLNQLAGYRSMQMTPHRRPGQPAVVVFPAFGARGPVEQVIGLYGADGRALVEHSPYGRAYRLARHLAARTSTPYGFIERVLGYLRRGYTYNENPRPDALPLVSFLFSTRQGYCQQFAGAMALLLRMGGVPARVVGGFTTGAYDRTTGQYRVSDLDAHAWVEAWFSGYGWVRFDPTPASAPARTGTVPLSGLNGELGNASRPARIHHRDITPAIARSRPGRRGASASTPLPIVIAIVVALGLLVMAARSATLRRGPSDEAWVLELERALARTGRAPPRRTDPGRTRAPPRPPLLRLPATSAPCAWVGSAAPQRLRQERAGEHCARSCERDSACRAGCEHCGRFPRSDFARRPTREPRRRNKIDVMDDDAYELYRRGTALLEGGHHHQAVIPLARARDLAPDKTSVREALGRALFHTQHYEQAAEEFQAVIDRAPTNDYALFCLGRSLQMLGRHAEARKPLAQAAGMQPGRRDYRRYRDQARRAAGASGQ